MSSTPFVLGSDTAKAYAQTFRAQCVSKALPFQSMSEHCHASICFAAAALSNGPQSTAQHVLCVAHQLAQIKMKFQDKLDIAIARGYIKQKQNILIFPTNLKANCLFPSFRNVRVTSVQRAMRRAGYVRATCGKNSWRRRANCVESVHHHQ